MSMIFRPDVGQSQILSASTTSAALTFYSESPTFRIVNAGPNAAFIRWGHGAQTALLTDLYFPVGNTEIFDKAQANSIAAICSTGTAVLYIAIGNGE